MNSSQINRATIGILAVLVTASGGAALHQANRADAAERTAAAWQTEAAGWQTIAGDATQRNADLAKRYRTLARQYTAAVDASQIPTSAAVTVADIPAPVAQAAPAAPPTSTAS